MAITRLSGGNTPPDGSDPRTFPAIWNDAVDDIEALELPITAARIADGAVTAPKLANTAGAVMVFDDATDRATAIPTPVEGMVTYLKDEDEVTVFDGSAFKAVGPGKILQVVSTAKTDSFSTASTSFVTITDLSASITPSSASSKILVMCQISASGADNAGMGHFKVVRGATDIYIGDASSNRIRAVVGGFDSGLVSGVELGSRQFSTMITFLDSPATTSSTTYNAQTRQAQTGTVFVNRNFREQDNERASRGASSITLMEVAG